MVRFACSTLTPRVCRFGSQAWTYTLLIKPCYGSVPHTKKRKIGTDVSSGAIFLKQTEKNWQQMLAQGESSSPKKKRKKEKKRNKGKKKETH